MREYTYIQYIPTVKYYQLAMINHLWAAYTRPLRIMTLLSRSSAPYRASCDQGSGQPGNRGCSRSLPDSDCTS